MREHHLPSPSVVVGIDGSRAAVCAALWAVDEAVRRDIPLRLLCAIPPGGATRLSVQDDEPKLGNAELAVRYASTAIESTDKPVKIELDIVHGIPIRALIAASRSAAMICVGAIGVSHFAPGRIGSTAAALTKSAFCPAAIIRGNGRPPSPQRRAVVVVIDETPDSGAVLAAALDEAQLRGARLDVLTMRQLRFDDVHGGQAGSAEVHDARARLDRFIAPWGRQYPDVDISPVVIQGSLVNYLVEKAHSIQMVVAGLGGRHDAASELVGPAGTAALHGAGCSVLIVSGVNL
jgi:nucleotide-binding universal stress UspA family protein